MTTIATHYAAPGLLPKITQGLAALGQTPESVHLDDLAPLDEFHMRGAAATAELIELLGVDPSAHVLDVGSGLGGPARRLADATGCRVTGIDLTADYCEVGNRLSEWTGLSDRVRLEHGDARDLSRFAPASFDAAWSIHVGMNLEDKTSAYRGVARALRPDAPFVIYDILATGAGKPSYPAPWASAPEHSFLATLDEMATHLEGAGFTLVEARDRTQDSIAFLDESFVRMRGASGPPPLGLDLVMGPAFPQILVSTREDLEAGRVAPTILWARKNGEGEES